MNAKLLGVLHVSEHQINKFRDSASGIHGRLSTLHCLPLKPPPLKEFIKMHERCLPTILCPVLVISAGLVPTPETKTWDHERIRPAGWIRPAGSEHVAVAYYTIVGNITMYQAIG